MHPVATDELTPRDFGYDRYGLPRQICVWYGSPSLEKEIVEALRFRNQITLRQTSVPSNLDVQTAGYFEKCHVRSWYSRQLEDGTIFFSAEVEEF